METFHPGRKNKLSALAIGGGYVLIWGANAFLPFGSGIGPLIVKAICLTFWTPMFVLALLYTNSLLAEITIRADRIERKTWFGIKSVRWVKLESLKRMGRGDTQIAVVGDRKKFSIFWSGYDKPNRLQAQLLEHLKDAPVASCYRWRPLFQPLALFLFGFIALLSFGCAGWIATGYFQIDDKVFFWIVEGILILGPLAILLLASGEVAVTQNSVRSDPVVGWRKELRYSEIALIEFGVCGEYGESEEMMIYGRKGQKLCLRSASSEDYADARDLIVSKVDCPINGMLPSEKKRLRR